MLKYLLIFSLFVSSYAIAGKEQSSVKAAAGSKKDTTQVNSLVDFATSYRKNDPQKAIEYVEAAIKTANEIGFSEGKIKALIEKKKCYFWLNQYQLSIQAAQQALYEAKKLNRPYWLIETYFNLANSYFTVSDYVKALTYQLEALKIAEKYPPNYRLLDIYNEVGIIYFREKNHSKAMEYYQKELDNIRILKDSSYLAAVYDNMAIIDENEMRYDDAIHKHLTAIKISENLKDTNGVISANNNLGLAYKKIGKFREAIEKYEVTYKLILKVKPVDSLWLSYTALNMGYAYTQLKLYKKAEELLVNACNYLVKNNDNVGTTDAYYNLFVLNQSKGDFKNALHYHLKYIAIKDSTFTIDKAKQISELQEKYNVDKKDFEIESLNQQNKIKESELKKQTILRNSFIGVAVLLIILIAVIYNRFAIKVKSAEELNKAHQDLKSTQQQLIQQEKLASLGSLTAGIAHEIKNPLNFVTNFSELSQELIAEFKESTDEEDRNDILEHLQSNLDKINYHGNRANSIVMSMLQHARGGEGEKQLTDINQICNEFTDLSYQGMRAQIPDFNCHIEKKLDPQVPMINIIPQDISRVILNLLNNAFYASHERLINTKEKSNTDQYSPKIEVITLKQPQHVLIKIVDNGSGIPDAIRQKIFEPFFTTKPSGEGTGLGLSICNDIIKAHGGSMKVESQINSFTAFIITLPI